MNNPHSQYVSDAGNRVAHLILFCLALLLSFDCSASLLITPSRVVFEDRTRSEQVTLVNKGSETTTYRISFIRQQMSEDGKFLPMEEGAEGRYSDTMVRFSPRQVTLEPGQSQIVRLMLRKKRDLEDGEYRSHMLFQALPTTSNSDINKAVAEDSNEITMEITTILGISIPVIVRHGNLNAEVELTNTLLVKDIKPYVMLDMKRSGNKSSYGDFRITYTDENNQSAIVGNIKGVAVYTPNTLRKIKIPLDTPSGVRFDKGSFHISYTESGKDESTGLIASVDLKL